MAFARPDVPWVSFLLFQSSSYEISFLVYLRLLSFNMRLQSPCIKTVENMDCVAKWITMFSMFEKMIVVYQIFNFSDPITSYAFS